MTNFEKIVFASSLVVATLSYYFLHSFYCPERLDDAWFFTFIHSYVKQGFQTDQFFGSGPGAMGYGGVAVFGKTYANIYGLALNMLGWTKSNAILISSFLWFLSSVVWIWILKKSGYSLKLSLFFGTALFMLEPGFFVANQIRPEALAFLIVSFSLLFALMRMYIVSGFMIALAFEVHPVAGVCVVYILAVFCEQVISSKMTPKEVVLVSLEMAAGLLMGGLYYVMLHWENLALLNTTLIGGNSRRSEGGNLFYEYFVMLERGRHLPESILFLFAFVFFLTGGFWRRNRKLLMMLIATAVIVVVVRRSNYTYMVYLFPSLLLMVLWLCYQKRYLALAMAVWTAFAACQYSYIYYQHRTWNSDQFAANLHKFVVDNQYPVVGGPNARFVFMNRPFFFFGHTQLHEFKMRPFYLIENEDVRAGNYPALSALLASGLNSKELGRFRGYGEEIIVMEISPFLR